MYPFTVYSVTELKVVFPDLIFWQFCLYQPNKNPTKINVSTAFCFTGAECWSYCNNNIQCKKSYCIVLILILQTCIYTFTHLIFKMGVLFNSKINHVIVSKKAKIRNRCLIMLKCIHIDSSFWFDSIHLGCSIEHIYGC